MRWDELFADLDRQWRAWEDTALPAEVREVAEAEAASVRWLDRLRGRTGAEVAVRLGADQWRRGRVLTVGAEWFLLAREGNVGQSVIPAASVSALQGLTLSAPADAVTSRLTLGHALRSLAQQRESVQVLTTAAEVSGIPVRVGQDFVDLQSGVQLLTLPWAGILCIDSTSST